MMEKMKKGEIWEHIRKVGKEGLVTRVTREVGEDGGERREREISEEQNGKFCR